MRVLQKELDEVRELRLRERDRETMRIQGDTEELQILRERCEHLEEENRGGSAQVYRLLIGLSVTDHPKG